MGTYATLVVFTTNGDFVKKIIDYYCRLALVKIITYQSVLATIFLCNLHKLKKNVKKILTFLNIYDNILIKKTKERK